MRKPAILFIYRLRNFAAATFYSAIWIYLLYGDEQLGQATMATIFAVLVVLELIYLYLRTIHNKKRKSWT